MAIRDGDDRRTEDKKVRNCPFQGNKEPGRESRRDWDEKEGKSGSKGSLTAAPSAPQCNQGVISSPAPARNQTPPAASGATGRAQGGGLGAGGSSHAKDRSGPALSHAPCPGHSPTQH